MVEAQHYEQALPALRCIAGQGRGFEIAQYLAGYSALKLSGDVNTPEILRPELRYEGFERLIDAAEAGWPSAQAELARAFLETDTEDAVGEAAYWAAIYLRNSRDRAYGLNRLDDSTEAEIEAWLDADDYAAALDRASGFVINDMTAVAATSQCAPFLRSASNRQSRGDRGQREGGRRGGGSRQGGGRPGGIIGTD